MVRNLKSCSIDFHLLLLIYSVNIFSFTHFLYSHDPYIYDQLVIMLGEIRCLSLLGLKGLNMNVFSEFIHYYNVTMHCVQKFHV